MYSKKVLNLFEKHSIDIGSSVKLVTKDGREYSGIIMPRSEFGDAECVVLKLENGYNIGIRVDSIRSVTLISKKRKDVGKKNVIKARRKISGKEKRITILHTGGTIASRVDYETGAVKAKFTPDELVDMFPEIEKYATINSRLIANALSENLRFEHYNVMIDEITKEIKRGVDGIIVTHGTDTMAYTAAALSFAFENLPVPIVLVGAQRSSDRPSSDAALNLISAVQFITNTDFCDVAICMHATTSDDFCNILPACKTRKMHSSARVAFQTINSMPYARVWPKEEVIEMVNDGFKKRSDVRGKLIVKKFNPKLKIGILKAHPNMLPEEVLAFKNFDGLIIEGTGLGHIGVEVFDVHSKLNRRVEKALKEVIDGGAVVVMTTQCLHGRVNMNVYSTGRKLVKMGVLGNMTDILPEVAFIKLAWLLSNYGKDEVKYLWNKNLRGEISPRSEAPFYQ